MRERIRSFIRLTKVCGGKRGFVRESERERERERERRSQRHIVLPEWRKTIKSGTIGGKTKHVHTLCVQSVRRRGVYE